LYTKITELYIVVRTSHIVRAVDYRSHKARITPFVYSVSQTRDLKTMYEMRTTICCLSDIRKTCLPVETAAEPLLALTAKPVDFKSLLV